MSHTMKRAVWLVPVLALLVGWVGSVQAGPYEGVKVILDASAPAAPAAAMTADNWNARTNEAKATALPPAQGAEVLIEAFMDTVSAAWGSVTQFDFDDTDSAFTKNFDLDTAFVSTTQGSKLTTVGDVGFTSIEFGEAAFDANKLWVVVRLKALRAIPEGTVLKMAGATIGSSPLAAASFDDSLDVTAASITFVTPPGPAIAADKGVTEAVVVPFDGTESDTVTVTATEVADTLAITWSVVTAGTDVNIHVVDASMMMMSEVVFTTAVGEKTIMLYADGKGASGTATIFAVAGTDTTSSIVVQFSRENPVELASFGGELVEDGVLLAWTTGSQTNNAGWRMLRSVDGENYEVVSGLLPGAGTTDALLNYSFVDKELPASEVVFYVLEQIDLDGAIHRSNEIEVILGARTLPLPTEFAVNAYPNPFNPSTTISYDLPEAQMVSIVIYDALGQEVRRLVNGQTAAGRYQAQWDAKDNHGRSVGSGVYIAKVEAGSFSTSQKMLLLK